MTKAQLIAILADVDDDAIMAIRLHSNLGGVHNISKITVNFRSDNDVSKDFVIMTADSVFELFDLTKVI